MASIVEDIDRNIIPLWRSYIQTAASGELEYTCSRVLPIRFDRFRDFLEAWKAKKSVNTAADLINAAVISDNRTLPEVLSASEFLLRNSEFCSPLAIDVARTLINQSHKEQVVAPESFDIATPSFDDKAKSLIDSLTDQETKIRARIGSLRKQLRDFCYNAITYCELSRCYSDLGLNDKARHYMLRAVQLAPHNRYVSRCAARFFVHDNDPARARKILIGNGWMRNDPWLLASEIAVTSVMQRTSRYVKEGKQLILSGNYSPYSSSELCFAICKEDRKAGKRKDWQKMFNLGLRSPNDNSLAQAEYIVKEETRMRFDYGQFDAVNRKYEADTRNFYGLGRYEDAFLSSVNWMQEFRFSHEPIAFAFDLSCTFLKKYDYSAAVIKHWLKTHPQDYAMANNLIYVLGLAGHIEEAEQLLSKINVAHQLTERLENGICLLATSGLIEYRKGNVEEGRQLYQLSIDTAKKMRERDLAGKARLNMIREEVHCVSDYDPSILNELDSLSTGNKAETEQLKKDIRKEAEMKEGKNR